jgi:hypothetical protein
MSPLAMLLRPLAVRWLTPVAKLLIPLAVLPTPNAELSVAFATL